MVEPSGLRRICLVGVRGVGKTRLIRDIASGMPSVEVVVGSAILRELAGEAFARFDHLPPDVKHRYREEAIRWMERRQETLGKHVLCDGHTPLLDESTGRVTPVFTELDCRFFGELVLLDASPELVLARRTGDPSKRRSLEPDVIRAELAGERTTSREIATAWNMAYHRLDGTDPAAAAARFAEILSR